MLSQSSGLVVEAGVRLMRLVFLQAGGRGGGCDSLMYES